MSSEEYPLGNSIQAQKESSEPWNIDFGPWITYKSSHSNRSIPVRPIGAQFNSMFPNSPIRAILPRLNAHTAYDAGGLHVNGDVVGQWVVGTVVRRPEGINIIINSLDRFVADFEAVRGSCPSNAAELKNRSRNCLEKEGRQKNGFNVTHDFARDD